MNKKAILRLQDAIEKSQYEKHTNAISDLYQKIKDFQLRIQGYRNLGIEGFRNSEIPQFSTY